MEGKVSMVVPCYNKEQYIGAMLDSVLAQEWNNIELILVNDGSTDGTYEVIVGYLPKFEKRGYEVKLINQENGGCCKAVHTGLLNMTGDYFCLVDADDEIEPQYVSRMASWLDEHDDYEWAACSYRSVFIIDGEKKENAKIQYPILQDTDNLLAHYIFRNVITTVWIYMSRSRYIHKSGMIDNFCTQRNKTYEPLIAVPLANCAGKMKFFDEALYRYNQYASDLYGFNSFDAAKAYYDDYLKMYDWAIRKLRITDEEKRTYLAMTKIAYHKELFVHLDMIKNFHISLLRKSISETIEEIFENTPPITQKQINQLEYGSLLYALEKSFSDESEVQDKKEYARVIAYGALGKEALRLMPLLEGTYLQPTELWDKNGDGHNVKQPSFESLSENDLILIFPKKLRVCVDIVKGIKCSDVIYNDEIREIIKSNVRSKFGRVRDDIR